MRDVVVQNLDVTFDLVSATGGVRIFLTLDLKILSRSDLNQKVEKIQGMFLMGCYCAKACDLLTLILLKCFLLAHLRHIPSNHKAIWIFSFITSV